jgi:hypothetical protein
MGEKLSLTEVCLIDLRELGKALQMKRILGSLVMRIPA